MMTTTAHEALIDALMQARERVVPYWKAVEHMKKYGIDIDSFIHDEWVVTLPEGMSEEQARIALVELKILFG